MARITVEDCLQNEPNLFNLVLLAAKRARRLANGAEATVEWENDKPTVVALREIAAGNITLEMLEEPEEPAQPPVVAKVVDPDEQFHPAVQVPVHHIGAADPDLAVLVLAGAERVDPGMLEEPAEHAADPDGVGEPRDSRPQRADAAHPQVDGDARMGRPVERVDDHLIDQRVGRATSSLRYGPVRL